MHSDPPSALLDRVRKLLAKAEAEGVTPPEAEALTAKAAELMARYGIDRARLAAAVVPAGVRSVRAWRRSWLLGFVTAVITRVKAAEDRAVTEAEAETQTGPGTALVLADRAVVIRRQLEQAYPVTRRTRGSRPVRR